MNFNSIHDQNATRWQKVSKSLLCSALFFISFSALTAQTPSRLEIDQVDAVEKCIYAFATAADKQDLKGLDAILHAEYRSILNKAFGSDEVTLLTKDAYIGMAKAGKIGGKPRSVKILSLDIQREVARATVVLQSEESRFTSFFSMIRNPDGNWVMIADLPQIDPVQ